MASKIDPSQPQVDSGIREDQSELPDRSGRLTGHTNQPMKGEPVKNAPETPPKDPARKPSTR